VRPRRKGRRTLERRGLARLIAEVTFTPDGGEPNTDSRRVKLRLDP
jgi:hypothetical protein